MENEEPIDGNSDHVYIREAADLLNRRMGTIRKWEQMGVLPLHLRAHRGIRGWRYWTRDQIESLKDWIRDTDRRSGKALKNWNPTEKEVNEAIEAMRKFHNPKKRTEEIEP